MALMEEKSGILLVDKPTGITSFDVIRKLRKILNIRKMGHAGTLDPFASGLMIIGVNKGTKLLPKLLLSDKKYLAELFFGATSSTDDPEGEKSVTPGADQFSKGELEKTLPEFLGKIRQVPPVYSALKVEGKRAADRVRAGEDMTAVMEAKAREVMIFSIQILKFDYPKVVLEVHCESGTYIRTLARDIGERMKTGAYLTNLRRTKIGEFEVENAKTLADASLSDIWSEGPP